MVFLELHDISFEEEVQCSKARQNYQIYMSFGLPVQYIKMPWIPHNWEKFQKLLISDRSVYYVGEDK